jgi:putative PIN family toxin of toxin-antitoxin system
MRTIADTNTVISGLLWHGAPRSVLDAARTGQIALFTTAALLAELEDVLLREKFVQRLTQVNLTARDMVLGYAALTTIVETVSIGPVILDDPDDDEVLACAIAANAKVIVSGDSHLLDLKTYQDIRILSAGDLLALL